MNVTLNNTKQQILDAYQSAVEKLKVKSSATLDPAGELANKRSNQVLADAKDIMSTSVEDTIRDLQDKMIVTLTGMSGEFATQISALKTIEESIKLKEAELKEVFNIEKTTHTLAGLVNAQENLKEVHLVEKLEFENKIDELENILSDKKTLLQKEVNELKIEAKKIHDREEADYKYEFARKKKEETDIFNDELAEKEKEFNDRLEVAQAVLANSEKLVTEREVVVTERETKLNDLEIIVASIPAKLEQVKLDTEEAVRKDEAKVSAIRESYAKKELENEKKVFTSENVMLKDIIVNKDKQLADLTAKLDAAYEKIQNMALATVDGSKSSEALRSIEKSFSDRSSK
jgi:hypothetical protein